MKILFITNGHGEDTIAARIIQELKGNDISVMPLVGTGEAFKGLNVNIIGPLKKMPSGGFVYQSFANIIKDLFSGLISNTFSQIRLLRSLKKKYDLIVSIGDIVPIIGALLTKTKFIFIGCAKSDYYSYSYTPWEKYFLKKYCSLCLPRDKKTTDNLIKYGVKAKYDGNPMMDCFTITGNDFGIEKDVFVVGILPGTRDDAHLNMEDISSAACELNKLAEKNNKKIDFLVAAAPNSVIARNGVTKQSQYNNGIASPPSADRNDRTNNHLNIRIYQDRFGDILSRSDVIIGLSGTGNEQAAGLGKPVVSFPGRGVQYTKLFAKRQKELLGEALCVTDNSPSLIAEKVWAILNDKNIYNKMSEAGRQRMGLPGASQRIASIIRVAEVVSTSAASRSDRGATRHRNMGE